MLRLIFIFFISISSIGFSLDIKEMVEKIDSLFRSDSSHGEISMTINNPHWKRTLKLEIWSRGMDETFLVIKSPLKDRGIATLRKDTEMWNYFPKIDKAIKVPPSMMMGAWMGSDFTNDDLVKESSLLHDYDASFIDDKKVEEGFVWISLKPKKNTVSLWGEIQLYVDISTSIPQKEIFYDEHNAEVRILYFENVKNMGGRLIPTVLRMVPLTKKDHTTVIKYLWVEFDNLVSDDIFSLRNLKKKR